MWRNLRGVKSSGKLSRRIHTENPKRSMIFYVNGQRQEVSALQSNETLIEFLRDKMGLTGTKLACGEGGCGACTVTLSRLEDGKVRHSAVNSCLVPLASVAGGMITTVEGVRGKDGGLHAVQKALAQSFGSQCGFCTPGFVMSLYSKAVDSAELSTAGLESSLDGNLCRCTGYRPIAQAVETLAHDARAQEVCYDFPAELREYQPSYLHIRGDTSESFAPTSLPQLTRLLSDYPGARIVEGNSEVGIEQRFLARELPVFIGTQFVRELRHFSFNHDEGVLSFGPSLPLSQLAERLQNLLGDCALTSAYFRRTFRAILDILQLFSGTSIRNVAGVGGNIATASPISDLNPVWVALDAEFELVSEMGVRVVSAADFFLPGYRETVLRPDEVLRSVTLRRRSDDTYVYTHKQSRRREDDIAIVNACAVLEVDGQGMVQCARMAFGGLGPSVVRSKSLRDGLAGEKLTLKKVDEAVSRLREELALPADAVGGMAEYRSDLAAAFLQRSLITLMTEHPALDAMVPAEQRSLVGALTTPAPQWFGDLKGTQVYAANREDSEGFRAVGRPMLHASAERQVTGEAVYTDDLPKFSNETAGSLVTTTIARGRIVRVDATQALRMPGVLGFISAEDVPGGNDVGELVRDEEVFVRDRVASVGQAIGLIVAETEAQARAAARAVHVEYDDESDDAVFTIAEAIQRDSFFPASRRIADDAKMEQARARPGLHTLRGTVEMGGQEHFYFEPQTSLCVPRDGEMLVVTSSQNLTKTQEVLAHVLNLPSHRIECSARRLGGGFGGKETQNIPYTAACAVAAAKLRRPVRLVLRRDEDMSWTGKRHPFRGDYEVGVDDEGRLVHVDVALTSNGGWSHDLSFPVLERGLLHVDNAYKLPPGATRALGRVAKTNLPSNTAFRGFGGPQGMLVTEAWMEQAAWTLGLTPEQVRRRNLYQPGQTTHYGQPLQHVDLEALWAHLDQSANLEARTSSVNAFNAEHRWKKKGLAVMPTKFGLSFTVPFLNQGAALVNVYLDGSVRVAHGGVEMGQGLHTKVIQVAADALGVDPEHVYVAETSTSTIPNATQTAASMGSDIYCQAVHDACLELRSRLAPYRQGREDRSLAEIASKAWMDRVDLQAKAHYKVPVYGFDWEKGVGEPFLYFTSGVAATEVLVDVLTGDHRVLRSDIVMDVGKSINPMIDIGQIEGAFVQGQGWTTIEELVWGDREHAWVRPGYLKSNGPGAYKIPSMDDIPREFNVTLMSNQRNPKAIHSSRGIGEPPFFLGASSLFAIRAAIRSARRDRNLPEYFPVISPMTCERILSSLK